ncbi:MAG TPA: L,D-transpeptidase family protein [Solirubrobacteraceae bacterium]|jgi:peptidoglycan hydrolase-like protein with peptidoglycan-binding domain
MATRQTSIGRLRAQPRSSWRLLAGALGTVALLIVAFAVAVLLLSGVSLASDQTALARVSVQPFGGSLRSVHAFGPHGRRIPLSVHEGRLTPRTRLTPGELITVEVVVSRPGWSSWALGATKHERLTMHAPVAHIGSRWLTVAEGAQPRVQFDQPVAAVGYGGGGKLRRRPLAEAGKQVTLQGRPSIGTALVAAAPRPWERLGAPARVAWFPKSSTPLVVASPAPGTQVSPAGRISLMFSKPVSQVLGSARPQLSPKTPGHWRLLDSHTLQFTPSGFGAAFASNLSVRLPHQVGVPAGPSGGGAVTQTSTLAWHVPAGSTLRLQQLLAQADYLPLEWSPSGAEVKRTPAAEVKAAVAPPAGHFSWRYGNTPTGLQELWSEGEAPEMVKGAVMMFEEEHDLTVDGIAGQDVWRALINAAIAGKRHQGGYTYVYVHREVPETLTLWHDGETVLTTPANTGIAGGETETELGTFAVFEHVPEGTMEGTNPDGSHYHDEGIKWISYFNKGEAIHNFDRASFGTPQSLGCVELPLQAAAEVWPYTPIGTLVTIAG